MKKYDDDFFTFIVTQLAENNNCDAAMSEIDTDGTMHINAEALQAMLDPSVKWNKLDEKETNEIRNRIQDRYNRCSCSEPIIVDDDSGKNSELCPHCYDKQLAERRKRGKKKKI